MPMLSEKLRNQFVEAAKEIRKSHEQFVQSYASACVECGGNDWRNKDYRMYFTAIRKELKPLLVDANILPSSVYYKHCAAAELTLLYEIPWSFANQVKADDLPEIKKRIAEDKNDDTLVAKFGRALEGVRREKRESRLQTDTKSLPHPAPDDTGERFGYKLCKCICEYAEQEDVKPFMKGDAASPLIIQLLRCAEMTVEIYEATRRKPVEATVQSEKRLASA